ncbi:hypothetical protein [Sphingomicrobium clamense]|uniref:Cell division protein FtsL n=1 Tax=Sphingomicrobium clamense TaxID=2851013 RepID=A0ABS6V4C5_9SPHN|nr:hypothetical protein [Sphingomicrobium sp. B8]MBW0144394.1 hypothetical protein [Sphingomicrobium sp. B8]
MSARTRSFRPIILAALVLVASLSCYLISLRVASERAALEGVERDIAMVTRDIRTLETEIGTRGRLAQLERWNARFLRLSAPRADQFVDTGFHLANLVTPQEQPALEAPVVLASADAPAREDVIETPATKPAAEMLQLASLERTVAPKPAAKPAKPVVDSLAPQGGDDDVRDPLAPIEVGASR